MHKKSLTDQRGFAHLVLIVALVLVVGAVGYATWSLFNRDKTLGGMAGDAVAKIVAGKECLNEFNDQDLCKFLNSWNANKKFKLDASSTVDGKTSRTVMTVDGDKSYMKMDGSYAMEVISMGDTTYTKAGEVWWKQTTKKTEVAESPVSKDDFKFEDPKEGSKDKNLTKYVKVGKEACGKLSCFKYQVSDPSNTYSNEYIWFDDEDYLIRKTVSEGKDGTRSESVFSYDNVSVSAPSPVKELAPNQYIIPGQSEPQTMPEVPTDYEM